MSDYKFEGKYIIRFDLRILTGLHIGGTTEGIEIGGLDNPVIKDPISGLPYIPGSSLKGKLRSVLEWELDKVFKNEKGEAPPHTCENDPGIVQLRNMMRDEHDKKEKEEKQKQYLAKLKEKIDSCPICRVFGLSASAEVGEPTRLTVRDAFPKRVFKPDENGNLIPDPEKDMVEIWKNTIGEGLYTEMKTENAIDRITSMANPRTMERVPKDSIFEIEMIYDIYKPDDINFLKYLFQAMHLLEDSFLGGSGSRGSGKIKFENPKISFRGKESYYKTPKSEEKPITLDEILKDIKNKTEASIPKRLYDEFMNIQWRIEGEKKTE
jgi:CRISPR-associated protein Csm3